MAEARQYRVRLLVTHGPETSGAYGDNLIFINTEGEFLGMSPEGACAVRWDWVAQRPPSGQGADEYLPKADVVYPVASDLLETISGG